MNMDKEFAGHLAFVTGGASGIGAQICADLAAAGASVVVADRQVTADLDLTASLPTGDGQVHLAIQLDVSKQGQVEAAAAEILKKYQRPADLIVNAAGIGGRWCPLVETSEEDLDLVMAINFKGTFFVMQEFAKALLDAQKPGSIVNISSILSHKPVTTGGPYCASKAAVTHLTKVAAREWGPKGIRVNSVHPGLIDTPLGRNFKLTSLWDQYEKSSSLQRVGKPQDVSNLVLFSLSERSNFITGSELEVSGQGVVET